MLALPGVMPAPIPAEFDAPELSSPDGAYTVRPTPLRSEHFAYVDVQEFLGQVSGVRVVAVPWPERPAPILGLFAAAGPRGALAAVVDLSPVSEAGLPERYRRILATPDRPTRSVARELPPWCSVFSSFCLAVTPADPAELEDFCAFAATVIEEYLAAIASEEPLDDLRSTADSSPTGTATGPPS
ncbi:hypothetical protein AB0K51_26075 [Kitasatospora sp. NPDC049285]|uniref:hypothetical protein n=1 Tax=Kitasatospora sp. NPDC049285 TaxID=3157096 RepID=UPI00342B8892